MNNIIEMRDCDYSDKYIGGKEIYFNKDEMRGNHRIIKLPTIMSEDLAKWLGMLVADGSILNKIPWRVSLSSGYQEITDLYTELTKKIFNINPIIRQDKKKPQLFS